MFTYTGTITRVIDGDTVEAVIDLGFQITHTIRVRLLNVHAPELFSGNVRHLGAQAQAYLEQLVLNKRATIHTHKDRMTFNRYLATIIIDTDNINERMETYCSTLL
jgi:micrococcal nuclease